MSNTLTTVSSYAQATTKLTVDNLLCAKLMSYSIDKDSFILSLNLKLNNLASVTLLREDWLYIYIYIYVKYEPIKACIMV